MDAPSPRAVQERLLRWFDATKRDMPWRRTKDPYRILVAEYLLQRTRVVSGTPYYERFLERFPDLRSLAEASVDEVLRAWEGLGFYGRARKLHAAARAIARDHGGIVPSDVEALQSLPGIGPYTAGAVASIAFGERVPAVDGNASRVLARLFRIEEDATRNPGRARLWAIADSLVPPWRPGAFNQALMELGATVCTPASPRCEACPLAEVCLARSAGIQASLPVRPRPRRAPTVRVAFGMIESEGRVLLVRRPDKGLLAGLWSLPGGEVRDSVDLREGLRALVHAQTGLRVRIGEEAARVAHVFSHRRWTGAIYRCDGEPTHGPSPTVRWVDPEDARRLPLVSFHREVLESLRPHRASNAPLRSPR